MILAERAIENIRSGVLDEAKFSLDSSGPIFGTIISGLYQNKKRAPLREYGANAYDASKQFDLQLPSILDPRVVIRDFGTGLSHDDVMHKFTTLGYSSKRASNDAVGSLGYGCKSAFAYTNQFHIRSFQNGEVRVYAASLEKDGIPRMVHLATSKTDAPDGLEVSFNVKRDDINAFREEAKSVFFAYDPRPNIKNETWEWPKDELITSGKGWSLHKTDALHGPQVRMGCVLYPLIMSNLGLTYEANWVKDDVLILDVPIGAVDIQHSREQLGYDERTVEYLKQRLVETKIDLQKHYLQEIDKFNHIIEAALFYARHKNTLIDRILGSKSARSWKGQTLPFRLMIPLTAPFQVSVIHRYRRTRRYRYNAQEIKTHNWEPGDGVPFDLFENPITIYIDQGEKNPSKRINHDGTWIGNDSALWVKTQNPQAVLDFFGNPEHVLYLKDLSEPPRPVYARTNPGPGANVEVLNQFGRSTDRITEVLEDGWFIDVEGRTPVFEGKRFQNEADCAVFFNYLRDAGIGIPELYGISEGKQKRKIFKNLKKLTLDELRRMIGKVDALAAVTHRQKLRGLEGLVDNINDEHADLKWPADIQSLIEERLKPKPSLNYEKYQLLQYMGMLTEQEKNIAPPPLVDINEIITSRWPLIEHIDPHTVPTNLLQEFINGR